jgi:hypothetical protein
LQVATTLLPYLWALIGFDFDQWPSNRPFDFVSKGTNRVMPFFASGMLRFGQIAGGHDQMGFWNALYVSSAPS